MKALGPGLLITFLASSAFADDWAVDVFLGGTSQGPLSFSGSDRPLDDGTIGGITFTRKPGQMPLELGVDLSHAANSLSDAANETLSATSLMATGRYSLGELGPINGYAGLGLGVLSIGNDDGTTTSNGEALGGQIMLGARYTIPKTTYQAFIEYRYIDTFDDADLGSANVDYDRQDVVLGIRLGF